MPAQENCTGLISPLTSRNVQKSRTARTPKEFPASGAEHLAADLFNVHLQLPHGLAGIQNVEHVEFPAQVTHFGRGERLWVAVADGSVTMTTQQVVD